MIPFTLPDMGPMMSSYQRRFIEDAPRYLFYYVGRQRKGLIPDKPRARQQATNIGGATHFDSLTFHRFNLDGTPGSFKAGEFYCRISPKITRHRKERPNNFLEINNSDIVEFVISLLTGLLRLPDAAPCKLIYLGRHTLGLTIPASAFGIDHGGELLPYLYREFHKSIVFLTKKFYDDSYEIMFSSRIDAENKLLWADTYAIPCRIGEINSDSAEFLESLSRTPRTALDMKLDHTFCPDYLSKLRMDALQAWRKKLCSAKSYMPSRLHQLTLLKDAKTGTPICGLEKKYSAIKCARKLLASIAKKGLVEFSGRNMLRSVSGSESLHGYADNGGGVEDALEILATYGYIYRCPFPPIDYGGRPPSTWYLINKDPHADICLHVEENAAIPVLDTNPVKET